jgi:cold shock CspA family protein/uncharacterized LabA/DUF88 family protein
MTSYAQSKSDMVRVGIFYDGHYFLQVSNYYNYVHDRRSRISIRGLHEFIRKQVAIEEDADFHRCQIIDAHYFRGRLSASEASQRGNLLYFERAFDDILMSEGVTVHYLPVRNFNGRWQEKGIDVWLALEAFEMAFYKRFDVVIILAADGDYAPLVKKLHSLGSRVMLLHWNFEYTDEEGNRFSTRTSNDLVTSVTYPIPMHDLMDDFSAQSEGIVNSLFVPKTESKVVSTKHDANWQPDPAEVGDEELHESIILSLKEGYGFIRFPPNNVFFHFSSVSGYDFNELQIGDKVQFTLEPKEDGRMMAKEVFVME